MLPLALDSDAHLRVRSTLAGSVRRPLDFYIVISDTQIELLYSHAMNHGAGNLRDVQWVALCDVRCATVAPLAARG